MIIAGIDKFSLNEYPGKPCAVVFTQGCNYRCPFCHNNELVLPDKFGKPIPESEVIEFLESRYPRLDAVAITGGEPTIQEDLVDFLLKIKKLNYSIKLSTNGSNSIRLEEIINRKLVDYIQMDIKSPWHKYRTLTGINTENIKDIKQSISLIETSSIPHEFRTTYYKFSLNDKDIEEIKSYVKNSSHIVNEYISH
jgi:pyruvate formate lyase activating enzyme